jgi:hypothetical protein
MKNFGFPYHSITIRIPNPSTDISLTKDSCGKKNFILKNLLKLRLLHTDKKLGSRLHRHVLKKLPLKIFWTFFGLH